MLSGGLRKTKQCNFPQYSVKNHVKIWIVTIGGL